jgi:hypothetical protein
LFLAALVGAPCLHAKPPVPLGIEFQVNTHTLLGQRYAAVGVNDDGDFVVTWMSLSQDGDGNGIFARRFDAAGVSQGVEFQVNSRTAGNQRYPAVGMDGDGDFVIVWHAVSQDGDSYGIFARRYDTAGVPQAVDFQVNAYTTGAQWYPALAMKSDGEFVVAWQSVNQDGSDNGIFARRVSAAGVPVASELQVNTYTTGIQRFADVAIDGEGDFVIAWQSLNQDGAYNGIFAQRFSAAGSPAASEFQVNTYTNFFQVRPAVALDADGDFVIAWESYRDGSGYGIFAKRFDSAGVVAGAEFQVNAFTGNHQRNPAVAMDGDGKFVVVWESKTQDDGAYYGVFGRRFNAAGVRQASEFQVNTYTTKNQRIPVVGLGDSGDFVVVWQSTTQDGDTEGVFAQRFASFAGLDIDGNGVTDPLTDGLLVLRFLFSFTGVNLTAGAVDTVACSRCDAAAIEQYLSGLGLVLDIDGNGGNDPLTDGLLVLRFLFSFTGANLTSGAVDTGACTRCDAAAITVYLQSLI